MRVYKETPIPRAEHAHICVRQHLLMRRHHHRRVLGVVELGVRVVRPALALAEQDGQAILAGHKVNVAAIARVDLDVERVEAWGVARLQACVREVVVRSPSLRRTSRKSFWENCCEPGGKMSKRVMPVPVTPAIQQAGDSRQRQSGTHAPVWLYTVKLA